MTEDEERWEAGNLKFDRRGTVMLRRLSTGRYALYEFSGVSAPFWIGDFADLEAGYEARPIPKPVAPRTPCVTKISGIDPTKVRFNI